MKTLSCGSLIELCTTRNSSCYYINLLSGSLNKLFTNGSCLSGFDQSAHTYSSRSKSGKNESWITGLKRKWIMNKLLAVRKFDILIANGNNKLLFNAPVETVPSKYFYLCHAAAILSQRDLKSFVYARLASFSLRQRGLTKLLKSPETKLPPRDKGLYISIHHFKNDRETNWTELTFAKTSGSVTIGTGEKNWPIADSGVSSTIPETTAGCVSASVLFSFLKRRMNTCIGQLVNTRTSLPQKQNV